MLVRCGKEPLLDVVVDCFLIQPLPPQRNLSSGRAKGPPPQFDRTGVENEGIEPAWVCPVHFLGHESRRQETMETARRERASLPVVDFTLDQVQFRVAVFSFESWDMNSVRSGATAARSRVLNARNSLR